MFGECAPLPLLPPAVNAASLLLIEFNRCVTLDSIRPSVEPVFACTAGYSGDYVRGGPNILAATCARSAMSTLLLIIDGAPGRAKVD